MTKERRRLQKGKELTENLIRFARALREEGVEITPGMVIDAARSLELVDLFDREQVRQALRANLTSSKEDIKKFDYLFSIYWDIPQDVELVTAPMPGEPKEEETAEAEEGQAVEVPTESTIFVEEVTEEGEGEGDVSEKEPQKVTIMTYSPTEVLGDKDFSAYTEEEAELVHRMVREFAEALATKMSRRFEAASSGSDVDRRRTLRMVMRHGGETAQLQWRRRRLKRPRILLLADVSGSMENYSKFLIQFIHGLQRELPNVETVVFSTRLTRITPVLKHYRLKEALDHLSKVVKDWAGGTTIGLCLERLNRGDLGRLVNGRTIVIFISDGWDRGDAELLEREMRRLKMTAYRVIWLNPLLGSPNYRPICKGMRAALPYIDFFLPAHNLRALLNMGRLLQELYQRASMMSAKEEREPWAVFSTTQ
jgi:uncharacterized protein with von Willebrand factor type A (vWA) domain